MADESEYLSEEEPTHKSQRFYCGFGYTVEYIYIFICRMDFAFDSKFCHMTELYSQFMFD